MKLCLHATILYTIHSELEDEIGTLDLHVQLKIEIIELDTFRGRQASEKRFWHGVQVCLECADVD